MFKMSSAEQFKHVQSLANVDKEGWIFPDKYWEIVGFDTPISFAISVLDFPDCSISFFKFWLITTSKISSIFITIILSVA